MDAPEILELIGKREATGTRWGIGTAAQYLKSIAPCLSSDGGVCPTAIFDKSTPELWQKALDEAAGRLTYCDDAMVIDTKSISRDFDRKAIAVKNAILTLDHVVTSSKKDRDGDIMECDGAEIDEAMPLLWQHIPLQPIGTYLGTRSKSSDAITGSSAILDTSLGRDAAVLVEGGALRISHGFKPFKAEPLYRKDVADLTPYGFRVQKFGVMEVSLVSVPANTDAVITAFSRKQLQNELVKSWAGRLHDGRPVVVQGVTLETKEAKESEMPTEQKACDCGMEKQVKVEMENATGDSIAAIAMPAATALETKAGKVFSRKNYDRIKNAHTCLTDCMKEMGDAAEYDDGKVDNDSNTNKAAVGLAVKSIVSLDSKAFGSESDFVSGSYEWVSQMLGNDAKRFLKESGVLPKYGDYYTYIAATFDGTAVIAARIYNDGQYETVCFSAAWSLANGKPAFGGEATEVKIESTVSAKSAVLFTKMQGGSAGDGIAANAKSFIADCLKHSDDARLAEARRDIAEAQSILADQRDAEEMRKLLAGV